MDEAEQAARNARRAMVLTLAAVIIAVIVLAIDQGIKRVVLEESKQARQMLGQVRTLAEEVRGGQAAGTSGDRGSADLSSSDSMGTGDPAGAVLGAAAGAESRPPADGPAGPEGGAQGDG